MRKSARPLAGWGLRLQTNSTAGHPRLAWLAAILAGSSVLVVASKGWIPFIQDWASYFWWLDYGSGPVRRGLAGQLFQMVFGVLTQKALYPPLMSLTVLWVGLLALALVIPFARAVARVSGRERAVLIALSAGLFVSQLWPMLTFTAGYLDPLLMVLATASALCLRRGWVWAAAAIAAVGPVVHEFFVFLVPFILAAALEDGGGERDRSAVQAIDTWDADPAPRLNWRLAVVGAASLIATAAVILVSKRGAAEAQFADMPLAADLKTTILSTSMNQSLSEAMGRMLQKIAAEPGFALCNVLFFVGPALIAAVGLVTWERPHALRTPLIQAAAGLLPAAAVLVAWDLSRFLVITTYTTGALFLWAAERRSRSEAAPAAASPTPVAARAALTVVLALAAAYALYPFTYTYFGYRSFFQYFPPAKVRMAMFRSAWAPGLESVWGHQDDPFVDEDVTCRLQPAGDAARACAHAIKVGEWVYGPYIKLPIGRYRVTARVDAPPGCTPPLLLQIASFRARPAPLAETPLHPGADTTIDFPVGIDLAGGRSDFEFRVTQASGASCGASLTHMSVRRMGG